MFSHFHRRRKVLRTRPLKQPALPSSSKISRGGNTRGVARSRCSEARGEFVRATAGQFAREERRRQNSKALKVRGRSMAEGQNASCALSRRHMWADHHNRQRASFSNREKLLRGAVRVILCTLISRWTVTRDYDGWWFYALSFKLAHPGIRTRGRGNVTSMCR